MPVHSDDLERLLERVRGDVSDPRAGIYGPGTASWNIGKESILFLGGGRAALLQLAHPFVAHAVDQHSSTRTDLIGRFQRTFVNVFAMIFGDLDRALRSARRVHAIHRKVTGNMTEDIGAFRQGDRYEANAEDALLWVHATLVDTAVLVYDLCVSPLDEHERDRYWRESKRFAALFGIPERALPESWADFRTYRERMFSQGLAVGRPAREMATFLFQPPTRAHEPFVRWYRLMTTGLLPERMRDQFDLRFGASDARIYRASLSAIASVYPHLPRRLRYLPAYVQARRRLAGKSGPDRLGKLLERIALRGMTL